MTRRSMSSEEFAKWEPLIHHVIKALFYWAYNSGEHTYPRYRRFLQYEDLSQEGAIGLLNAWKKYDPEKANASQFKTYAYKAIANRISRYVDANFTPISTNGWRKVKNNSEVKEQLRAAIGCVLYSELNSYSRGMESPEYDVKADSPPVDAMIEQEEWVGHCIQRLTRDLGKKKVNLLLQRAAGKTLTKLGKARRYSRERARQVLADSLILAVVSLAGEEDKQLEG